MYTWDTVRSTYATHKRFRDFCNASRKKKYGMDTRGAHTTLITACSILNQSLPCHVVQCLLDFLDFFEDAREDVFNEIECLPIPKSINTGYHNDKIRSRRFWRSLHNKISRGVPVSKNKKKKYKKHYARIQRYFIQREEKMTQWRDEWLHGYRVRVEYRRGRVFTITGPSPHCVADTVRKLRDKSWGRHACHIRICYFNYFIANNDGPDLV